MEICLNNKIANLLQLTEPLTTTWHNPTADVTPLERQTDQLVYQLYGLTPAEIALVEGSA